MAGELSKKAGNMANIIAHNPLAGDSDSTPDLIAEVQIQNVKAMFNANNDTDIDNGIVIPDNGHGMICGLFDFVFGASGSDILIPIRMERTDSGVFDYSPFISSPNFGFGPSSRLELTIRYPVGGAGPIVQYPGIIFY